MAEKEQVSNLIWIIAIVILLTFLIVVISWMSSGKLKVEKNEVEQKTTEMEAESRTFIPEVQENEKKIQKETNPSVVEANNFTKENISQEHEKEKLKAEATATEIEPQQVETIKPQIAQKEPPLKPEKEKKVEEIKGNYALQVGAFSSIENAKSFEKKLSARGYKTTTRPKGNLTAVFIIDLPTQQDAINLKEKLAKENIQSSIISNF